MSLSRREMLRVTGAAVVLAATDRMLAADPPASGQSSIDRQAVVRRHNPVVHQIDPYAALSVGNGEFAFTADVTGLQTFLEPYDKDFPLCTASHWGWHTTPISEGLHAQDLKYKSIDTYGRPVGYATDSKGQEPLFNWLRENPHRLHLGRIGLALTRSDGAAAQPSEITQIDQSLNMWTALLTSKFQFNGKPVAVQTCCHPTLDMIAVRIDSPLISSGNLKVLIAFPYGSQQVNMADWNGPERHQTTYRRTGNQISFDRTLNSDKYFAALSWAGEASFSERGPHSYLLGAAGQSLQFTCRFSPESIKDASPTVEQTQQASAAHWQKFWSEGGAIDLGNSTDPRALELERRIVLSQYNTSLHCAGSLPSQETGLLFNSWFGKFHLEMHWWHSVHFTAWNRFSLFENSLSLYQRILPIAQEIAQRQGYKGARWPKMIGPDGHDSPSGVGPLIIWQQPHPIYYAELCYRHDPSPKTLDRWREIVFQSADFMASYAVLLAQRGQYVLGPPMKTVSENQDIGTTVNPTFELAYWRFGLRVAQSWRQRLGMARDPKWDEVLTKLAPLPVKDGLYLFQDGCDDTYTKWNWEHPALVGAFGVQPGDGVDKETMHRSLKRVMEVWEWDRAWGWDFPMAAMAAARVGEPELAVRALLIDSVKNRYLPNGHDYQRPGLTAYLPANGGLLSATAMMAAGWTDGPTSNAPGFPADGKWAVRHEGLSRWM